MVYLYGIIGFIGGFAIGLFVINLFLRRRQAAELVQDKSLRWTYGLAVWIMAGLGSWAGVWLYRESVF